MAEISVIIPTLNAAREIGPALGSISSLDGLALIREVIFADGGSEDEIEKIAEACGAEIVTAVPGRGGQLRCGLDAAAGSWILILHADTRLGAGWENSLQVFMQNHEDRAGYFRFALDDEGVMPWLLARLVALRCRLFALPYGDQGLFISRALYDEIGGYRDIPLMEDVDLVRRLGRKRLQLIDVAATTSAVRYRRSGYIRRSLRNLVCLTLYFLGIAPDRIKRMYEK